MSRNTAIFNRLIILFNNAVKPYHYTPLDGIEYWRDKIALSLLFFAVFIGFFTFLPSFVLSVIEDTWGIAVNSLAVYVAANVIFWKKSWPYQVRAFAIVIVMYVTGMVLNITVGPYGVGLIFLFAFSVFSGLLLGIKYSFIALFINLLSLVFLGILIYLNRLSWVELNPYPYHFLVWWVIGINFYILNIITTISMVYVLKGLQDSLIREVETSKSLEMKHSLLNLSNQRLSNEINERKRVQYYLHKSEEKYRTLVTQMNEGVIITDVNFKINLVNPKALEISFFEESDLFSQGIDKLFDKENFNIVKNHMTIEGSPIKNSFEATLKTKFGGDVPLLISGSTVADENDALGFILALTDISQLKSVETELKIHQEELEDKIKLRTAELESAKKNAEQANHTKSLFLANISHELRTPMHGIMGFAKLGKAKVKKMSREKFAYFFGEIINSAQRLLFLLNDLLDLSKIESGKLEYKFEVQSLSEAAQIGMCELRTLFDEKEILVDFGKPEGAANALFDKERIVQVIKNLLSNAVKFSAKQSRIIIDIAHQSNCLVLSVTDFGVGVPESELETIFDEFVQSSKTKSASGGTGLGLAISKKIIEKHQGRIWAEINPEGGTIVKFKLPGKEI